MMPNRAEVNKMWSALEFLKNPYFWVTLFGLAVVGWGVLSKVFKYFPILRNRNTVIMIAIGGFLFTSGIFAAMGFGSVGSSQDPKVYISDLQVTTDFAGNCTIAESGITDDLVEVRCTDANAVETADALELSTGVITVTRRGDLVPMSCPVVASTVRDYESEATPGDGTKYTILEQTTKGELEAYIRTCSTSSCASATTYPKEKTDLAFDEGVSTGYVGLVLEVDEDAHDNLNQYSYRDVVLNICGKPMTFRVHRMD